MFIAYVRTTPPTTTITTVAATTSPPEPETSRIYIKLHKSVSNQRYNFCDYKEFQIKIYNICSETIPIDCEAPFDEVTVTGTVITSPNYPNDYENNEDCQVTIRFAADQVVRIRFEEFDVQLGSTLCPFDYLVVHDGENSSSPIIGSKLCGTSPGGTTIQSTRNVMTLHFHTDGGVVRSGFKIYADAGKNIIKFQIVYHK